VFDQVTENDHREALTVAERVAAYEHLAAFGVGAAQIAKGMATSRPEVDSALTVAAAWARADRAERARPAQAVPCSRSRRVRR
jgi:ParB-like chromosome segregation protein Spo0J